MAAVAGSSLREKYKSTNSLICLLQGIMGRVTTVELRNESSARGKIDNVDGFMNVKMTNVLFTTPDGTEMNMQEFFVKGPQIRYVHIPDDVNMLQVMKQQLPGYGRGMGRGRGQGPKGQGKGRGGNAGNLPQPD